MMMTDLLRSRVWIVAAGVLLASAAHSDWSVSVQEARTAKAGLVVRDSTAFDVGMSMTEASVGFSSDIGERWRTSAAVFYHSSETTGERPLSQPQNWAMPEWGLYALELHLVAESRLHRLRVRPRLRSATNDSRDPEELQLSADYSLRLSPALTLGLAYTSVFGVSRLLPLVGYERGGLSVVFPLRGEWRVVRGRLTVVASAAQWGGQFRDVGPIRDYRVRHTEFSAEASVAIFRGWSISARGGALAFRRFDVDIVDAGVTRRNLDLASFGSIELRY